MYDQINYSIRKIKSVKHHRQQYFYVRWANRWILFLIFKRTPYFDPSKQSPARPTLLIKKIIIRYDLFLFSSKLIRAFEINSEKILIAYLNANAEIRSKKAIE